MITDTVFICYSNKDVDNANEIDKALKNAGVNTWIKTINGIDDDDIQVAIKSAKLFLIITSNNAFNDETLKQEKNYARVNNVDRQLLKIESCDTEDKMRWNTLPSVDYSANDDTWLQTILNKIKTSTENNEESSDIKRDVVTKSSASIEEENNVEVPKTPTTPIKEEVPTTNVDEFLNELSEDFEYYRFKMTNQIKSSYYGLGALVTASVILLVGLYFWDGFQEFMEKGQEKLKYLGTVGGLIPSTLSTFSISKIKEKKKRRDGIDDFERILSRMKKGLVPNSKEHILDLEDEFIKYIKS